MKTIQKLLRLTALAALVILFGTPVHAATNSNTGTVALSATVNTSLTVSLSGAMEIWSTLNSNAPTPGNASNPGNAGITVTTSWVLQPGHTSVALYSYFSSAVAALTPLVGTTNIPSSAIEIKVGAGAFTPVSGTNAGFGVAGSSLLLQTTAITGANKVSTATAALTFNLNLSTLPQLPADTYSGTLNIQAQATP
jgi:hypothetical protein